MSVLNQMKKRLGSPSSTKNIKVLDLEITSGNQLKIIGEMETANERSKLLKVSLYLDQIRIQKLIRNVNTPPSQTDSPKKILKLKSTEEGVPLLKALGLVQFHSHPL